MATARPETAFSFFSDDPHRPLGRHSGLRTKPERSVAFKGQRNDGGMTRCLGTSREQSEMKGIASLCAIGRRRKRETSAVHVSKCPCRCGFPCRIILSRCCLRRNSPVPASLRGLWHPEAGRREDDNGVRRRRLRRSSMRSRGRAWDRCAGRRASSGESGAPPSSCAEDPACMHAFQDAHADTGTPPREVCRAFFSSARC